MNDNVRALSLPPPLGDHFFVFSSYLIVRQFLMFESLLLLLLLLLPKDMNAECLFSKGRKQSLWVWFLWQPHLMQQKLDYL